MKSTIAAFIVAGLMSTAGASAQVFTSLSTFQTAIGNDPGAYTETFTGGAGNSVLQNFSGGSPLMAYAVTAGGGTPSLYREGTFIGNNFSNATLTFTFTTSNVFAVGGNFFVSDINDAFVANASVTLNFSDGSTDTFTPSGVADFRGYVSSTAISSLVMTAPGAGRFNTVDNLIVSSIPTPGAAAMLGFAGLVAAGRRRRA